MKIVSFVVMNHVSYALELSCNFQAENVILSGSGVVKLCDYGSATTRVVRPTEDWTHQQRAMLEDEVCLPLIFISLFSSRSKMSQNFPFLL